MRESRSSGSVGERGGNDPLYPERLTVSMFPYLEEKFSKTLNEVFEEDQK